jgi:benzoyl-CoA reductase/2-hydroxyglutaryl-CoA dehydratase subunit BcrC/BadD/HgdB
MRIFENFRDLSVMNLENAKKNKTKIVGLYCAFAPQEIVLAAGAIPVSLCGTKNEPVADAEKVLPRNLCPLIKSSFGFAITNTCPFFRLSDFVIAETTCDGKKKMFEFLQQYKPLHVMQLPQRTDGSKAFDWWVDELRVLKNKLEENLGVEISADSIRQAVKLTNRERQTMRRLHEMNKIDPAPLTGLDMLAALWVKDFNVDKEDGIELVDGLIEEVAEIAVKGTSPFPKDTPRILLTGCPVGLGSEKVIMLIEKCGGSVVCLENCSGIKTLEYLVEESESRDPLEALAERYLKIPCSCMSPNSGRFELLNRLITEYRVDGVVDLTWQACHTYNIEAEMVRDFVRKDFDLPFLHLETDYSSSDLQQLQTRISAFIEVAARRRPL